MPKFLVSFCHSPADIRASARAGVCADRRGSVRENLQENDQNLSVKIALNGFLMILCDLLDISSWNEVKYSRILATGFGVLSYTFSTFRELNLMGNTCQSRTLSV